MSRPKNWYDLGSIAAQEPDKVEGKVKTKTEQGKLALLTVECAMAGDRDKIVVAPSCESLFLHIENGQSESVQVCMPRKRALTFARILRAMALQLPKDGE